MPLAQKWINYLPQHHAKCNTAQCQPVSENCPRSMIVLQALHSAPEIFINSEHFMCLRFTCKTQSGAPQHINGTKIKLTAIFTTQKQAVLRQTLDAHFLSYASN